MKKPLDRIDWDDGLIQRLTELHARGYSSREIATKMGSEFVGLRFTRNSIIAMMEMAARDGRKWLEAAKSADQRSARAGGTNVVLTYENTPHVRTIEFRGYEYTREPSAVSGALLTRYNPKKPQIWRIPLADEVRPAAAVTAPRGGYIVPAAYAQLVGEKLALHGVEFRKLTAASKGVDAEVFRATKVTAAPASFEGHTPVTLEGQWTRERREWIKPAHLLVRDDE